MKVFQFFHIYLSNFVTKTAKKRNHIESRYELTFIEIEEHQSEEWNDSKYENHDSYSSEILLPNKLNQILIEFLKSFYPVCFFVKQLVKVFLQTIASYIISECLCNAFNFNLLRLEICVH